MEDPQDIQKSESQENAQEQNDQKAQKEEKQEKEKIEEQNDTECILCSDECVIYGIIKCNHGPICHVCSYKMRVLNQSYNCPICMTKSPGLIFSSRKNTKYDDYNIEKIKMIDKDKGIYASCKESNQAYKDLIELRCFYSNCNEKKSFESMAFLKKHLKEKHQRYLCEYCLENKKCVLNEHILYSRLGYDRHLQQGDTDQDGFIYFFHPFCTFCEKVFYDEEKLVTHMTEHFTCFICGDDKKYIFYKDYLSLEKHFRISHYLCEDVYCLQQAFIAFKSAQEFEIHQRKVHRVNMNQNVNVLTGFKYEDDSQQKGQKGKVQQGEQNGGKKQRDDGNIRDREGVDFRMQYLSQQEAKSQITCIDEHKDGQFDFRDFYNLKYNDEDVEKESDILRFILSTESYRDLDQQVKQREEEGGGEMKKKKTEEYYYKKLESSRQVYLEDLRFFQLNIGNQYQTIKESQFDEKISKIFDQDRWDDYHELKNRFFKKKINEQQFLSEFLSLCGNYIGFRMFQLFLRTIQNEHTAKKLDSEYLKELNKLPKKIPNLINTVESYSEFFRRFREEIEKNIIHRIESKRLSMKKRIKMERSRIYQLIEILRRIKTDEMSKLKFAINFGLSSEGMDYVINKVYFSSLDKLHERINKIPTQDFLKLYLYISICDDMISGKYTRKDMNKISTLIFKDFFEKNPQIVENYCKKYRTNISDDDSDQERKNNFKQNLRNKIIGTDMHFPSLPSVPKNLESQSSIQSNLKEEIENQENKDQQYSNQSANSLELKQTQSQEMLLQQQNSQEQIKKEQANQQKILELEKINQQLNEKLLQEEKEKKIIQQKLENEQKLKLEAEKILQENERQKQEDLKMVVLVNKKESNKKDKKDKKEKEKESKWQKDQQEDIEPQFVTEKMNIKPVKENIVNFASDDEEEQPNKAVIQKEAPKNKTNSTVKNAPTTNKQPANMEWWEESYEQGGYDKEIESTGKNQLEKAKIEFGDSDDEKQKEKNQWKQNQNIPQGAAKIKYENTDVGIRITQNLKESEQFPTLGGGIAGIQTESNDLGILGVVDKKKDKKKGKLEKQKMHEVPVQQPAQNANKKDDWEKKNVNPFVEKKDNLEEEFPDFLNVNKKSQNQKQKQQESEQDKQQNQEQDILLNRKSNNTQNQRKVENQWGEKGDKEEKLQEIGKKKKNGKEIIYIAGGFK